MDKIDKVKAAIRAYVRLLFMLVGKTKGRAIVEAVLEEIDVSASTGSESV